MYQFSIAARISLQPLLTDGRKGSRRVAPASKLSEAERQQILTVANSPEFASSPPGQIVPTLADRGEYLA